MQSNLDAAVEAMLSGLILPIERAASGELGGAVADAQAVRGQELIAEMFDAETAPSGAPWAPPAHDYGHPLLRKTGELASSGKCEPGPRLDASGHDLTFSFTDEKAPWQHFGTKRGGTHPSGTRRKSGAAGEAERQHIPPRPLLPAEGQAGPWQEELDAAGQVACDRWLDQNVRA